ncbi:MAG: UDP-N-acetylmuramoyl-L-alanine--D-glutamate ligase [Lachnospiraceae bacterium]|nr:UDP-N-acetylmuramoyl-L-alanine--D-glutamate ligase [Lachnospiraceae bacterium]
MSKDKYLVIGAGKSGVASSKLLLECDETPVLYDSRSEYDFSTLKEENPEIKDIECLCGELDDEVLSNIKCCVVSPGVPLDTPFIESLRDKDLPIIGEIELAYRMSKGEVFAITGTNGKTTTTALTGKIFADYFDSTFVVGNIGIPYTSVAKKTKENSKVIAEISSFQLESIVDFRPKVSAILNITPDHLNRHHTMENYIKAKEAITKNQSSDEYCILNYEDEELRDFGKKTNCKVVFFSSKREVENGVYYSSGALYSTMNGEKVHIIDVDELKILGLHNYENAACAIAFAILANIPLDSIRKSLREFVAVEHRIEYVTEKRGVRFYNDSKGTNPDASIKAVLAMNRPILLIGGGYDKKISYDEWVDLFPGRVKKFAIIGETKMMLKKSCDRIGFKDYEIFDTMEEAIDYCYENAKEGDCVLLSPASASWDMFKSYEARGDIFKEYVRNLSE